MKRFVLAAIIIFFFIPAGIRAEDGDAIAIRVIPNPRHFSAADWYKNQGFAGSPQALTVDGYDAIRDGRTVYANVGNTNAGGAMFTNIYLISYNQSAKLPTIDIFGSILAKWKFNSNLTVSGACRKEPAIHCLIDEDCPIGDHCGSPKARVIRDVRRLSDISGIRLILDSFRQKTGKYPALLSGTYLPSRSFSAWPSWQSGLGKELSRQLPFDPVNRFGACAGFNEQTCWNEASKRFATVVPELPDDSLVYYYSSDAAGMTANICMVSESGFNIQPSPGCVLPVCLDFDDDGFGSPPSPVCDNPSADCNDNDPAVNVPSAEICNNNIDDDCDGLLDCFDSSCLGNPLCSASLFCGDGECNGTETCSSCSLDCICGGAVCGDGICSIALGECGSCYGAGQDCRCGDTDICSIRGEECDDGNLANGDGCSSVCQNEIVPCTDNDGDLYIAQNTAIAQCNAQSPSPCGLSRNQVCLGNNDCNDSNSGIRPGAAEVCDGIDHDCDGNPTNGFLDENCSWTCVGHGFEWTNNSGFLNCCGNDAGEGGFGSNPFQAAENSPLDYCADAIDNDCDGRFDSAANNPVNPDFDCLACNSANNTNESFWFVFGQADCDQCDLAGDQHGNQTVGENWSAWPADTVDRCDAACGTVATTVHSYQYQAAEASCGDLIDNDCDGLLDCVDPDCIGSSACVFSCIGSEPANSGICAGDDLGLAVNTTRTLVGACTAGQKCEHVCNAGFTLSAGLCRRNCYRDADGDGFGNPADAQLEAACSAGRVADNTDCDDARSFVFPGAPEQCNGLDSDCSAASPIDNGCDSDSDDYCDAAMPWFSATLACPFTLSGPNGNDCNDADSAVNPGSAEICSGGVDDDCDSAVDCLDTDCLGNAACLTAENCGNGADDDGDSCIDAIDSDCGGIESACADGLDNDCDGSPDAIDSDCLPPCCTFDAMLPCNLCA